MKLEALAAKIATVRNPLARVHDYFIRRHVAGLSADLANSVIYRHSLLVIALKCAGVGAALYCMYLVHPVLGGWMEKGFAFFRLHQIYKFSFPTRAFFDRTALAGMGVFAAYHTAGFLYRQLLGLFSVLAVDVQGRCVAYVKSAVLFKETFLLRADDIDVVRLGQNLAGRIFGTGTLDLTLRTGGVFRLPSLSRARGAARDILAVKAGPGPRAAAGESPLPSANDEPGTRGTAGDGERGPLSEGPDDAVSY